jgi:hypothetical protein
MAQGALVKLWLMKDATTGRIVAVRIAGVRKTFIYSPWAIESRTALK